MRDEKRKRDVWKVEKKKMRWEGIYNKWPCCFVALPIAIGNSNVISNRDQRKLQSFYQQPNHNREFYYIFQLWSLKFAFLLPKTMALLLLSIAILKIGYFLWSLSQAQVYRITSNWKDHNFLILNPIFMIHILLESSLSLISNGIIFTPKFHVNLKLWSKNQTRV